MKRTLLISLAAVALVVSACSTAASPTPEPATPSPAPAGDIVAVATEAGSFTTLLTAATAAGLVETLQGEGPYTVFAPTDEAFAALPEGTLEALLADPEALKKVLLYHVVEGKVTSDQVVGLTTATTVEGSPIAISVEDGTVSLNDSAKVVTVDVMASNGVIHVIDAVILPPEM
jgi:transforming growth factor-beta-induced protein